MISLLVRKIFSSLKLVQSHGIVSDSDEIFYFEWYICHFATDDDDEEEESR